MDEELIAKARIIYEQNNISPLFLRVADFYLCINELQRALSILETGLKIFPDHPLAHLLMGKVHLKLGNTDMAESFFKQSGKILGNERMIFHYRKEFGLADKKLSPFDSSGRNNPADLLSNGEKSDGSVNKSSELIENRLPQIAEELINKRIERTAEFSYTDSNEKEYLPDKSKLASETFAQIYLSQGQKAEAIKIYELLAQREPYNKEYYLEKIREIKG